MRMALGASAHPRPAVDMGEDDADAGSILSSLIQRRLLESCFLVSVTRRGGEPG